MATNVAGATDSTSTYSYSKDEALSALKKAGVSFEEVKGWYEETNLKTAAKRAKIGHVRLRAIFHALDLVPMEHKTKKILKNRADAEGRKKADRELARRLELEGVDLEDIESKLTLYGTEGALSFYDESKILAFREENPTFKMPHSSTIRSNLQRLRVELSENAIEEMLKGGYGTQDIALKINTSHPVLVSYLQKRYPHETFNFISHPALVESHEIQSLRRKKTLEKRARNRDILLGEASQVSQWIFNEQRTCWAIALELKVELEDVIRYNFENYGESLDEDRGSIDAIHFVNAARKNGFKDIDCQLKGVDLKQAVPLRYHKYPNLYIIWSSLQNKAALERIIVENHFRSIRETIDSFHPLTPSYINGKIIELDIYDSLAVSKEEREIYEKILKAGQLESPWSGPNDLKRVMNSRVFSMDEFLKKSGLALSVAKKIAATFGAYRLSNYSEPEAKIAHLLHEWGVEFKHQARDVIESDTRLELDFYIPNLNLGIEVNPTHTHNATKGFRGKAAHITKDYHHKKFKSSIDKDIELIQLYDRDLHEDQWEKTAALLKFKILGPEKILYARETSVKRAEDNEAKREIKQFIESNHSHGNAPSSQYWGFYHDGTLVGAASFSTNKQLHGDFELKRLVFLPGLQIRFGISKLVSNFFAVNDAKSLYSYSYNDRSSGRAYLNSGFTRVRDTGPTLKYVNPKDPLDSYSWAVASPWGAKSGIIARKLGSRECSGSEARRLVLEELPHRHGPGRGYVELWNAGSTLWKIERSSEVRQPAVQAKLQAGVRYNHPEG